jgi:hypothetical protein
MAGFFFFECKKKEKEKIIVPPDLSAEDQKKLKDSFDLFKTKLITELETEKNLDPLLRIVKEGYASFSCETDDGEDKRTYKFTDREALNKCTNYKLVIKLLKQGTRKDIYTGVHLWLDVEKERELYIDFGYNKKKKTWEIWTLMKEVPP